MSNPGQKSGIRSYNRQQYIHLHKLPLERVLPEISRDAKKANFDGYSVNVHSLRLRTFKEKGVDCVRCGIRGSHFWIDDFATQSRNTTHHNASHHLNLYAIRQDGEEVLMTHDHIIPRSRGGKNEIENTQTMCFYCNSDKGSGD